MSDSQPDLPQQRDLRHRCAALRAAPLAAKWHSAFGVGNAFEENLKREERRQAPGMKPSLEKAPREVQMRSYIQEEHNAC